MKNKLMIKMMLSCEKATELIEKKHHKNLSFNEQFQLKLHTSMCNACKSYEKQSKVIESALNMLSKEEATSNKIDENQVKSLEKKIIDKLEK